jgi:hypothetical protein
MKKIIAIALTMLTLGMGTSYSMGTPSGSINADATSKSLSFFKEIMQHPQADVLAKAVVAVVKNDNADAKEAKPSRFARIKHACGAALSTSYSYAKQFCGLPYSSISWLLSHTILHKDIFGENTAKVVAALGLVAAAIFTPTLAPYYMHEIATAIMILSATFLTAETIEAFCMLYSAFCTIKPFAPIAIALVAVVDYFKQTGTKGKALDATIKAFDKLPADIVDAGRNAASKLMDSIPNLNQHINTAAEAATKAASWLEHLKR